MMAKRSSRLHDGVEALPGLLDSMVSMPCHKATMLPIRMPSSGVYVFSERSRPLYVGRSRRMRERIREHFRDDIRKAAFSVLLAREATGLRATYRRGQGRMQLRSIEAFEDAFQAARRRIAGMDVRWVEVKDDRLQAMFEMFAAEQLHTQYSSFRTT